MIELGILTVEDLTLAIKNCVNSLRGTRKIGLSEDEAYDVAYCVLNFFGYSDRIIDNVLESGDRSIFYELEDIGILSTEREETTLYDGREWRIHYWLFRHDKIERLLKEGTPSDRAAPKPDFDYADLPEDAWSRE